MVTIKDIAREAGVSHATVSCVLNGKAKQLRISDVASERIKAAADQLGYQRNEIARSMATGRNDVIAFVSCDTGAWEYTGKIMSGIVEEATRQNFAVKVYNLAHSAHDNILRQLIEQRIAGVIFHSSQEIDFDLIRHEADKKNIPSATVNLSNATAGIGVTSDDFQGVKDAVKHLTGLGHCRIAYISDKSRLEFAVNRENGFMAGMKEYVPSVGNLQIAYGVSTEDDDENQPVIRNILLKSKDKRPTAIICCTDYIACNVLQVACQMGIKVPKDISVIGFADLEVAKYAVVPLTTVAQPFEQMGRETANMLIETIKNKRIGILDKAENRKLEVALVIRKSTAPPQETF